MKKFKIKAYLAAGLSYRLECLDGQEVVNTLGGDAEEAVRANLSVVRKIEEGNIEFMAATKTIYDRKVAVLKEGQDKYKEQSIGKSDEEKQKMMVEIRADFEKRSAEIQKDSTAKSDEIVEVVIGDDDYEKVLKPLFKKTVASWENDKGQGQRVFIEVADAINAAVEW